MMSADLIKWRAIPRLWAFSVELPPLGNNKKYWELEGCEPLGKYIQNSLLNELCWYSIMKIFTFNSSVASIVRLSKENPLASERSCNYPRLVYYVCYDKLTIYWIPKSPIPIYNGKSDFELELELYWCRHEDLCVNPGKFRAYFYRLQLQVYSNFFVQKLRLHWRGKSTAGQVCQGST